MKVQKCEICLVNFSKKNFPRAVPCCKFLVCESCIVLNPPCLKCMQTNLLDISIPLQFQCRACLQFSSKASEECELCQKCVCIECYNDHECCLASEYRKILNQMKIDAMKEFEESRISINIENIMKKLELLRNDIFINTVNIDLSDRVISFKDKFEELSDSTSLTEVDDFSEINSAYKDKSYSFRFNKPLLTSFAAEIEDIRKDVDLIHCLFEQTEIPKSIVSFTKFSNINDSITIASAFLNNWHNIKLQKCSKNDNHSVILIDLFHTESFALLINTKRGPIIKIYNSDTILDRSLNFSSMCNKEEISTACYSPNLEAFILLNSSRNRIYVCYLHENKKPEEVIFKHAILDICSNELQTFLDTPMALTTLKKQPEYKYKQKSTYSKLSACIEDRVICIRNEFNDVKFYIYNLLTRNLLLNPEILYTGSMKSRVCICSIFNYKYFGLGVIDKQCFKLGLLDGNGRVVRLLKIDNIKAIVNALVVENCLYVLSSSCLLSSKLQ